VSPKDRKHDLETATSSGSHIGVLTLKIPAGYVLQGVPTDAEKTTPYGSYSFKYSYADGILTVTEHDATDRMRVTLPELAAYLDYRTAIMQEFGKSIVLRKGP
jgi:hypothetical protein